MPTPIHAMVHALLGAHATYWLPIGACNPTLCPIHVFRPAQYVSLNASASGCGGVVRTPQGLVAEPQMCKGCYSMLYTGIDTSEHGYRNECWVLLQNAAEM